MKRLHNLAILFISGLLAGCSQSEAPVTADPLDVANASEFTLALNRGVSRSLPLDDPRDFADATRGLIARADNSRITFGNGKLLWDAGDYAFVGDKAPETVNPSLWRQESLNNVRGLFRVTEGVYQVRGMDLANLTVIEGDSGWIVIDPLTSSETAAAAMKLVSDHLGQKPIKAVLFTHSHVDHFGGVLGVVTEEQSRAQGVRIIAPVGFMDAATSENILLGTAMGRRSGFMYGRNLPVSPKGKIGSGLGSEPVLGSVGIIEPTELINKTGERKIIDGVEFVFQLVSGSEAPSEFTFYLPQKKAFGGAELVSRNLHNLYTLRGAEVRDALLWSDYLDEAQRLFADAEVYFGSHHWPIWGSEAIRELLQKHRDSYKYIHDQTVRLINQGFNAEELAERLHMPDALGQYLPARGYYGTVSHNAKAVYQRYMGWFDGNPANLNPLPVEQTAERYVSLLGGADQLLKEAGEAADQGDYRWAAELLNYLVFSKYSSAEGRQLLARCYDQLGYQAEAASWRNYYLSAALELRDGKPASGIDMSNLRVLLQNTPVEYFLDAMSVRLDPEKAAGKQLAIRIDFTDVDKAKDGRKSRWLFIKNSVMHHYSESEVAAHPEFSRMEVDAGLEIDHSLFLKMVMGEANLIDLLFSDQLQLHGGKLKLIEFFQLFEAQGDGLFNLVTP